MTRSSLSSVSSDRNDGQNDSNFDDTTPLSGGFIVNDPDLKRRKKSRRLRASRKSQVSYTEDTESEDWNQEETPEDDYMSETVADRRPRKPLSRTKKKINTEDDDYDDDLFNATEYGLKEEYHTRDYDLDEDDDEVIIIPSIKSRGRTVEDAIDLSDIEDDLQVKDVKEEDSDTPLASTTKTKKKAPAKKRAPRKTKEKKPKITYHQRITEKLFEFHPDLADVFPTLEQTKPITPERAEQPEGMGVDLLPFQLEGLNWLIKQEEGIYNGGILADEMGMGKTIQTIALFLNDRTKRPNLVVAPTVALVQWKNEIEQHAGENLSVVMFHGANRTQDVEELASYDVILTTYAVLESVYRKQQYGFKRKGNTVKEKSVLHSIQFHRVVLDEAHNIKDRQSNTAKAANMLNSKKRWCLSGTPLQNRIGEMYSLIRFLDIEPFGQYFCTRCPCRSKHWKFTDWRHCDDCGHVPMQHTNFFNHFMLKNIQKFGIEGAGLASFQNIQALLKNIMLRRTKVERADDLGLPPRVEEIRRDFFNEEERDLYQSLYSDSKRKFNEYVAEGVVLNNYANIFTLITRMRQLADHPDLVLRKVQSNKDLPEGLSGVIVCQLCDDEAEDPIESKCHHKFCRMCIKEYSDSFGGATEKLECPVCHIALSIDLQGPAIEVNQDNFKKGSIVNRIKMGGEWRSSTKIEALVEELYKLRSDRQTIKSIVFSQFTSMLDLVEWRLKRAGFQTVKLQGSMTPAQRDNTIRYFMENTNVEVFLVSLKAGGVALNLCEASQVFLMDPWWNPSLEMQAGGRIHRIGQYRPVKITRFCIEDSIEARIIELQDKKADMINATINHDDAAISRLTPDDLQFLFMN